MIKISTVLKKKLRNFVEDDIGNYSDFIIALQNNAMDLRSLMKIHDPKLYNDVMTMKEEDQWKNYEDRLFFINTTIRAIHFFYKYSCTI
ncbi:MAG TPA: hypothetical protein P5509_04725 [Bacteroidales bacterium]|nr:hypothetical protein [Bacteroidales bacterium]